MELKVVYTGVHARRVLSVLVAAAALLAALHIVLFVLDTPIRMGALRRLFDLDAESGLGTWFATVQLYTIALVAFLASWLNLRRSVVPSWWLAIGGCGFLFFSADEGAVIHERLTGVMREMEQDQLLFEGGHGGWVIPYIIAGLLVLILVARPTLRVLRHYPRESMVAAAGAVVIAVGAVGLEVLSYRYLREPGREKWYQLEVAAEEFMEMAGASLILYGLLLLAGRISQPVAAERSNPSLRKVNPRSATAASEQRL